MTSAVLLAGGSVGILVGLSVSPVVGSVISSMLALVISAIALLAGIKHPKLGDALSVNIWPVAALFFALMIGSLAGVRLRTVEWLHAGPEEPMKRWTEPPFGLGKDIVAKRPFDLAYPSEADTGTEGKGDSKHQPTAGATPTGGNFLYDSAINLSVCGKIQIAGPMQKEMLSPLKTVSTGSV